MQEPPMKASVRFSCAPPRPLSGAPRQKGATSAEFVIAGAVAILVILAFIQMGFLIIAKQVLNEAAFEGARMGASEHGRRADVLRGIMRKLQPFYQDSTNTNDAKRLALASTKEVLDIDLANINPLTASVLTVTRLSPPAAAFNAFGINVDDGKGHRVLAIPNDNLEYRTYASNAGLSIQDANEFRIKVTYAYELKVPMMKTVFRSVLCSFDRGVTVFEGGGSFNGGISNCVKYYRNGRVPVTTYATVQMQSDAWQDPDWK
jgi:TadE-like protein